MTTLHVDAPDSCKVYTQPELADAIVRRLGDDGTASWLEPSVGPGVFLQSISGIGVNAERVTALDIERDVCKLHDLAHLILGQDFVEWSQQTTARFDRIVGNPPYVALSRLPVLLRERALSVRTPWNQAVTNKANYWYVFTCAILSVLRRGGSVGLILPAALEYADYCAELKERLPRLFRRLEVHRSLKSLFGTVGEGAIVILGYGYLETPCSAKRIEHPNLSSLVAFLNTSKNRNSMTATTRAVSKTSACDKVCQLSEIANVRIGAVTGDVSFFLFNQEQRRASDLPRHCFRPILSRSRHINAPEVTKRHWERLRAAGERVWLFSPFDKDIEDEGVQRYLNLPESEGGCKRAAYKVRNREPWYKVISPEPVDGFMSGMSTAGPFVCLNAIPKLTASNTLYVIQFKPHISVAARYAWALSMLSSHAHASSLGLLRLYADGLTKHEPKDLLRIELPYPRNTGNMRDVYSEAIGLKLAGKSDAARRIADCNIT